MNISEVYSGSYLKADDLQGRRVTVKINHVSVKEFEGDRGSTDRKIVIGFEGKEKCLVANKTNATIIAEVLGSQNTEDWVGGTIKLESRKVEFSGRLVPAIRVVLEEQQESKPKPAPVSEAQRKGITQTDPDVPLPEDGDTPF